MVRGVIAINCARAAPLCPSLIAGHWALQAVVDRKTLLQVLGLLTKPSNRSVRSLDCCRWHHAACCQSLDSLFDPTLPITRMLCSHHQYRSVDAFERATSHEGQAAIKKVCLRSHGAACAHHLHRTHHCCCVLTLWFAVQFWESHATTLSKLPAIAFLDASACPRGLAGDVFAALCCRLAGWAAWQAWDVRAALDPGCCGSVSWAWVRQSTSV